MSSPAKRSRRLPARSAVLACASLMASLVWNSVVLANASDASLDVTVVDARGVALEHAVVSLHSGEPTSAAPNTVAVMDQRNLQFAPTVVAIQAGTVVEFPNQDDVRHHVYSFSHPNAFELKLYHGRTGNYNQFESPGVVVLGCNIHDGMLGYLRVVDTPVFGTSDAAGKLTIADVASGDHQLQVWHPDLGMNIMRQSLSLVSGENVLRLSLNDADTVEPAVKAAHPLQSLFRD